MRSRWAVLAAALVISAGTLLATTVGPRALAENNGLAVSAPLMGWSSWSFLRSDPTAAKIEAEASALKSSGLSAHGYDYVNLDDFWYQCPGSQGPNVDQYGRWVTDATKFPASGVHQWHRCRRELRAQPGPEVRPVRDAGHLQAGGGAEHPDRGHVRHGRSDRHHRQPRATTTAAA